MINEEFWNRELKLFEIPKFQCPYCQKGLLISEKDNIIEEETRASKYISEEESYEGQFIVISKCNNPNCEEITTIAGKIDTILNGWNNGRDSETGEKLFEPSPNFDKRYMINYTQPAIRLINFPQNTPKDLVEIINESFQLFWIDEASCGNKIRSSIEELLNLQRVRKTTTRNRKRRLLNLHQRIIAFKAKQPEIANYLLALKWIGNQGSHSNIELSKKELVDAYKILEVSLIDLYDKTRLEVNRLTKKINKDKKHKVK